MAKGRGNKVERGSARWFSRLHNMPTYLDLDYSWGWSEEAEGLKLSWHGCVLYGFLGSSGNLKVGAGFFERLVA